MRCEPTDGGKPYPIQTLYIDYQRGKVVNLNIPWHAPPSIETTYRNYKTLTPPEKLISILIEEYIDTNHNGRMLPWLINYSIGDSGLPWYADFIARNNEILDMKDSWEVIKEKLSQLGCLDKLNLNSGCSQSEIEVLEQHLGVELPADLKEFLSVHNGQFFRGLGLFFESQFLSTSEIAQRWDSWRELDEEEMNKDCADYMRSNPEGFIKPLYINKFWIPLTFDWAGNHIGIDFDPGKKGIPGQIIAFGRDEDTKLLIAENFTDFISKFIQALDTASWKEERFRGEFKTLSSFQ
ncbi:SMI1/KNR4 family protein [Microbulbifer sp. SSSA007]|uniref:SMI1/KNR4 family protein n=1 Tax=Microbulbifer sp. SSSA007 TaxID=3243379 RepID=UPI004039916A